VQLAEAPEIEEPQEGRPPAQAGSAGEAVSSPSSA
jgi:hypothetical protein